MPNTTKAPQGAFLLIDKNSTINNDMPVITKELHFSTPIFVFEKPEFLASAREACVEVLNCRRKVQELDDIYPVLMTENMFDNPQVKDLVDFTVQTAWDILVSEGYQMKNLGTYFTEFWCQEHYKHSLMEQHVHGNGAQIVGFYFIDSPENCSMVQFHDPRPGKVQINLPEADNKIITHASNSIFYKATPGTLLFAPAWLAHGFTRHKNDEPMRFIHFNVNVKSMPPARSSAPTLATVI